MTQSLTPEQLANCDREPIHVPGAIQPFGAMLVVDPVDLVVVQAAVATDGPLGGVDPIGRPLPELLPPADAVLADRLREHARADGTVLLGTARWPAVGGDRTCHAIGHRSGDRLVLELETVVDGTAMSLDTLHPLLQDFLGALETASGVGALGELATRQVRRLTGMDRVLLYRFDERWDGTVIAEDRNDRLPSLLGLRFPAGDIPAPARELYRRNRLRLIPDADARPVPILPTLDPATGAAPDLSHAVLRSVSPVHLEYMRNMGTRSSMSISLMRSGRLWGLLSCHHHAPYRVPYPVRMACDLIGQVLSMQLAGREQAVVAERRGALRALQARLLAAMAAADDFAAGLASHPTELLRLVDAGGAALVTETGCRLVGDTPSEPEVRRIAGWLAGQDGEAIHSEALALEMPGADAFADRASGVLAIPVSRLHASYLLWFRPEVVRTVTWGGDPRKQAPRADGALGPRRSFAAWQETVRGRALPWTEVEVEAAIELRTAIVDIVLRQAEETAALSDRLTRTNHELEAFSYSVSHDLRAPFRHIVGYAQLLQKNEGEHLTGRARRYLETIIEAAHAAGRLVDDLLSFSQMGRASLRPVSVDLAELVADVQRRLPPDVAARSIDWRVGPLPRVEADPAMLRLVIQNLLDNAIKFTRDRDPAVIEIGSRRERSEVIVSVRDNGAGFDMAYAAKLFGVFQRLHQVEEFPGTGIGLANVKRIVERHGGRVMAEGKPGAGATFSFALPSR